MKRKFLFLLLVVFALGSCQGGRNSFSEERVRRDAEKRFRNKNWRMDEDSLRIRIKRRRKRGTADLRFTAKYENGRRYRMRYKFYYKRRKRGRWRLRRYKKMRSKRIRDKDSDDDKDRGSDDKDKDDGGKISGSSVISNERISSDLKLKLSLDSVTIDGRPKVKKYSKNGQEKVEVKVFIKKDGGRTRYKMIYAKDKDSFKLKHVMEKKAGVWTKI